MTALPAIRQRISRLEGGFVVNRLAGFPPLSTKEIEELVSGFGHGGDLMG